MFSHLLLWMAWLFYFVLTFVCLTVGSSYPGLESVHLNSKFVFGRFKSTRCPNYNIPRNLFKFILLVCATVTIYFKTNKNTNESRWHKRYVKYILSSIFQRISWILSNIHYSQYTNAWQCENIWLINLTLFHPYFT